MLSSQLRPAAPAVAHSRLRRSAARPAAMSPRAEESMTDAYARIRASRAASKKKFEREQAVEKAGAFGKLLGGVLGALDFQENIAADRAALDDARRLGKGQRMSDSSAGALRRKVGGTKSGFFGEQVELKGKYADQGYVTTREAAPLPFVPFLVAVVLGIVAATVVVVAKTG